MKSLFSIQSTLLILAVAILIPCLYLSKGSPNYEIRDYSSFLGGETRSCKALLSDEMASVTPSTKYHTDILIDEETLEMMNRIDDLDKRAGVLEEDHSQFWLHKNAKGEFIKTKHSVVIYHGLWNSPSWTKWFAKKAFEMGFNVINIRLPKHNHARENELNSLERDDFLAQTTLMRDLGERIGIQVVYLGHSAGGNSAIHSALIGMEKTSGLIPLGTALKLRPGTYFFSFALGRTFLSNIPINMRAETFDRYRSLGAGRATHYFGKYLKQWIGGKQYRGLIADLRRLNVLQIEVENDGTINSEVNIEVGRAAETDLHVMSSELAHVDMLRPPGYFPEGSAQAVEMAKIDTLLTEFLNNLPE